MAGLKLHAVFHGPNPFADSPVVVASFRTDEALEAKAEALCRRFRARFPAWFEAPLPESSVPAVMLGQAASRWALRALNEIRGFLHDAGARPSPEGAHVWVGFHDVGLSASMLDLAFKTLVGGGKPGPQGMERDLTSLLNKCAELHPDFQANILMQGARAAGIPFRPFMRATKCWQYGWGSRSTIFRECSPFDNGGRLTSDKVSSKEVFRSVGAPTPKHCLVQSKADLKEAAAAVGWPCVLKPTSESKGKGVTAGIVSLEALEAAFEHATRSTDGRIMVEPHVPGFDHRILVANGRFFRTARRQPSVLIGDGQHSVAELLETLNKTRSGNLLQAGYLKQIKTDEAVLAHLAGQGFSLASIPPPGARVTLRSNANVSTGGFATNVTDETHPDIRRMAELITQTMGLVTAGLDYITEDIGKSPFEVGAFIEINGNSGMDVIMAGGDDAVALGRAVLGSRPERIPVTMVVLPAAELLEAEHFMRSRQWPRDTAWACGSRAGIGDTPLLVAGAAPWPAVDMILTLRATERAWIVCNEQDILRHGLPVSGVERILLSGIDLPAEWNAVLAANAGRVERPPRWQTVIDMGVAAPPPKTSATAGMFG